MSNPKGPAVAAAIARQLAEDLEHLNREPDVDVLASTWATWRELETAMEPEALGGLPNPCNFARD
jgi:hypothetical protein